MITRRYFNVNGDDDVGTNVVGNYSVVPLTLYVLPLLDRPFSIQRLGFAMLLDDGPTLLPSWLGWGGLVTPLTVGFRHQVLDANGTTLWQPRPAKATTFKSMDDFVAASSGIALLHDVGTGVNPQFLIIVEIDLRDDSSPHGVRVPEDGSVELVLNDDFTGRSITYTYFYLDALLQNNRV